MSNIADFHIQQEQNLLRTLIHLVLAWSVGLGLAVTILLMGPQSFAKGGGLKGEGAVSVGYISVSAVQGDLNSVIETVAAQSSISTKQITSGYELFAQYVLRFSGTMFAVAFRPAIFSAGQTGSGAAGDYNYKLSGFSLFPLLRLYPSKIVLSIFTCKVAWVGENSLEISPRGLILCPLRAVITVRLAGWV